MISFLRAWVVFPKHFLPAAHRCFLLFSPTGTKEAKTSHKQVEAHFKGVRPWWEVAVGERNDTGHIMPTMEKGKRQAWDATLEYQTWA